MVGVVGAAIAALAGNIILALFGYVVAASIMKIRHVHLLLFLFKLILATSLMMLAVYVVNLSQHFIIAIAAGAVIYPTLILVLRAITLQDIKMASKLARGRT